MDDMMKYAEDGGMGDLFDQIDDLLDFPNEDDHLLGILDQEQQQQLLPFSTDIDDPVFLPQEQQQQQQQQLEEQSDDIEIIPLEWMSQFLEDSDTLLNNSSIHECFSSCSPISVQQPNTNTNSNEITNTNFNEITNKSFSSSSSSSSSTLSSSSSFPYCYNNDYNQLPISAIPVRTRSKRPRSATAVVASRPRITINSPVKPPSCLPNPVIHSPISTTFTSTTSEHESIGDSQSFAHTKKKKKMAKKKAVSDDEYLDGNSDIEQENTNANVRKCLHCEITKTPQWRAGPMGPRTLCNACGVRYKSGRLFPEYRPAASPTFVPSIHSNSHKKVVEMRNKVNSKNSSCELLDYIRMQRVN